ncbi:MAG: hypothetical protein ABIW82_12535 [Dokdonella sp.]
MKSTYFFLIGWTALACTTAAMAQPPQVANQLEADFAAQAARVSSPARMGAVQSLRSFAARYQGEAGTLPQGFPFDVQDAGDMQGASIGYGFQVYDADPNSLMAGESLDASAHATGIWRFAVTVAGRPVGLLTMAEGAAGWEAVSMGGAGLVKEVDAVVYAQGSKPAAQLRYVRVPQATADFIEIKGAANGERFAPLQAARESLRLATGDKSAGSDGLLADAEVRSQLRDAVARNLAN